MRALGPNRAANRGRINCNCQIRFAVRKTSRPGNATLFSSSGTAFCLTSPRDNRLNFTRRNCLGGFGCEMRGNGGMALSVANSGEGAYLCMGNGLHRRLNPLALCTVRRGSLTAFRGDSAATTRPVICGPSTGVRCRHALIFPLRGTNSFGDQVAKIGIRRR